MVTCVTLSLSLTVITPYATTRLTHLRIVMLVNI